MDNLRIKEITEFKSSDVTAINRLLEQLSSTARSFTETDLREIIACPNSHLFFLYTEDTVAGMLTVGSYQSPTGRKYWVEDVVVDKTFRGQSFGKKLIEHAIEFVGKQKSATLMLTSNPSRVAANNLYRSVGFQQKQTNVYKMTFE